MREDLMRKLLVLLVLVTAVLAQEPYTVEKGKGALRLAGRTVDQVWPVVVRMFMTQPDAGRLGDTPVTPDRPSLLIRGAWVTGQGFMAYVSEMAVLFEEGPDGLTLYCTAQPTKRSVQSDGWRNKAIRGFFDELLQREKCN